MSTDLNPVAVGIAATPESGEPTSIQQRVEPVVAQRQAERPEGRQGGSEAAAVASSDVEMNLWLCPIEDRQRQESAREGMVVAFTLGSESACEPAGWASSREQGRSARGSFKRL